MRVASLGLCTDEIVLLLAKPGQVVSVSFLSHDPHETPLAAKAKALHSNSGRFNSVVALRPDLVITGGAVNMLAREMAERMGVDVLDIPPPQTLDQLRASIRSIAAALDVVMRGEALIGWMDARLGKRPLLRHKALMIVTGGLTPLPGSLTEDLLSYAGIAHQTQPRSQVTRETLYANPDLQLIVSDYRSGQYSLPQEWLNITAHAANQPPVHVDGRLWTCPGPLAAADVERLRRVFSK